MEHGKDIGALLNQAAQTLGTDRSQLESAAANPQLAALLGKLSAQDIAKLSAIIRDRGQLEKLISSEQGQRILEQLSAQKKDGEQR